MIIKSLILTSGYVTVKDLTPYLPAAINYYVLHVVIENFGGNALQVFEGPLVTIKKRFQGATVNELKVHGPAKAQHH